MSVLHHRRERPCLRLIFDKKCTAVIRYEVDGRFYRTKQSCGSPDIEGETRPIHYKPENPESVSKGSNGIGLCSA